MPEVTNPPETPAQQATEDAKVEAVQAQVEAVHQEQHTDDALIGRIADAVLDRVKTYTETLMQASQAAADAMSTLAPPEAPPADSTVAPPEAPPEDVRPARTHALFHKPLKRRE